MNIEQHDDEGAVLVEFAIVFTLFISLLWGILMYGFVFALDQSMTHAAAEGARAAVVSATGTEEATAQAVVADQLDWIGGYGQHLVVTTNVAPCDYEATRNCITVTVSYPYADQPIIPSLLKVIAPERILTEATAQL